MICSLAGAASAMPKDATFVAEGPNYVAEAGGEGDTEAEAQNDALRAAIAVVMESLGKDRLFSELFLKNPPVTMEWKRLSSVKGAASTTVRVRLVVDDESLRLLYNASYVSTVSTMLDGAEARLADAERLGLDARKAESDGQLGRAMSLYWQSRDACDTALDLLSPIGDAAVFSTTGKKKAPELREVIAAVRGSAVSGYDRIKAAERGLAEDEELSSALSALEAIEGEVAAAETWSQGVAPRAARIEGTPKAELQAFSDELGARYRALSDARLALGRVEESVPRSKEILRSRIEVARRRVDGIADYARKTKAGVDREIRDPAIARARRSQNIRWVFLHEPSGALALRVYTPFGIDPAAKDIRLVDTERFEFSLRSEGAFGRDKGVWIATAFRKDDAALSTPNSAGDAVKNTGYSQYIDLGFYGNGLFGAGFSWDWLRDVDRETVGKRPALRLLIGGMSESRDEAAALAVLSWEFPYESETFEWANVLNVGLDAFLRLGKAVELDAGVALRTRENSEEGYDTSLRYSIGAGFRLPKPFLWGLEYAGHASAPAGFDFDRSGSYIRMFVEYSL